MKILVVSQFFWPENFRINDLAEELQHRGHEVTVLTGLPNYPKGHWFQGYGLKSCGYDHRNKIKVVRVPIFPRFSSKKWQLAINYLSFAFSASFFGLFYCRDNYDVIFTYAPSPLTVGIPAVLMRWIKRAPMVFWVQDLWPEVFKAVEAPKSKFFFASVSLMMVWIYKRCDLVLVQSKDFVKHVVKAGAKESKVYYFPNWAEELYRPIKTNKKTREYNEIPKDGFIAMFAGNIGAAQSLETIINAADKIKNHSIHWIILGDGRKRQWLEKEISKRQLNKCFHILGHQPVETMPSYFSLADVLLVTLQPHPVMSAWIPGKVQSYLASGKPIIGALNGAGASVIRHSGAGFAVEAGDSDGLAEKVLILSQMDTKERELMGHAALEFYKKFFHRKTLITRLEEYFYEIS